MRGIERNEIMGDWYEDIQEAMETPPCYFCQSKEHAAEDCPWEDDDWQPMTDEDYDNWHDDEYSDVPF